MIAYGQKLFCWERELEWLHKCTHTGSFNMCNVHVLHYTYIHIQYYLGDVRYKYFHWLFSINVHHFKVVPKVTESIAEHTSHITWYKLHNDVPSVNENNTHFYWRGLRSTIVVNMHLYCFTCSTQHHTLLTAHHNNSTMLITTW